MISASFRSKLTLVFELSSISLLQPCKIALIIINLIKNFNGNENFIKIVNSSVFSSNDNIISDNYKITNNEKIAIIPPIGGG